VDFDLDLADEWRIRGFIFVLVDWTVSVHLMRSANYDVLGFGTLWLN
jgi:hypothetical protein